MASEPTITGIVDEFDIQHLTYVLGNMGPQIRDKLLKKTMRSAAKDIVLPHAQRLVLVRTGKLGVSLTVGTQKKDPNTILYRVYASTAGGRGGWYAHMIERGHKFVVRKREGKVVVGYYPAHPFLRPALEENSQKILSYMLTEIQAINVRLANRKARAARRASRLAARGGR